MGREEENQNLWTQKKMKRNKTVKKNIVYNKGKGRDKIVSKAAVTKCYSWVSEEK